MSTVVLYCWCHSDGTSVLLYFYIMILIIMFDSKVFVFEDLLTLDFFWKMKRYIS